ncbi:MAG: hypothetical protein ABR497_04185, partial [Kiritimatiellia bacterium]
MPNFKYVAADSQGAEKSGVMQGSNRAVVMAKLRESGLFPSRIDEVAPKADPRRSTKPAAKPAAGPKKEINIP